MSNEPLTISFFLPDFTTRIRIPKKKGYKLHGPSIKHCNGTGYWDDNGDPICVREYFRPFLKWYRFLVCLYDSVRLTEQWALKPIANFYSHI